MNYPELQEHHHEIHQLAKRKKQNYEIHQPAQSLKTSLWNSPTTWELKKQHHDIHQTIELTKLHSTNLLRALRKTTWNPPTSAVLLKIQAA